MLADNIIVKTKYGYRLRINPLTDKGIEKKIFETGIYEEGTLWCFKNMINKNDIIFDVGANIGLTTIYASILAGKNGKIFAFEPFPSTFSILMENIRLNKVQNIFPQPLGLSDQKGIFEMHDNMHINRGAASLYSQKKIKGVKVDVDTLDNFVSEKNIEKIDFIKIDIEGSELPMLKGALQFLKSENKPILCIEFSRDVTSPFNPDDLFDLLKYELKYAVYKQVGGKESRTPLMEVKEKKNLPNHDNLYCFQPYHFKKLPKDLFVK